MGERGGRGGEGSSHDSYYHPSDARTHPPAGPLLLDPHHAGRALREGAPAEVADVDPPGGIRRDAGGHRSKLRSPPAGGVAAPPGGVTPSTLWRSDRTGSILLR